MLPNLTVSISGNSTTLIQVSVEVHQELNQHGWCFAEFRATSDNRPQVESWLGQTITVQVTDEDGSAIIFTGFVWQAELHFNRSGGYNALIIGVTNSWKLQVTHDQKAFKNLSLPAIAAQIGGEDGVPVTVSASNATPWQYLVQWGVPDTTFLVMRAYERQSWLRATEEGVDIRDTFDGGQPLAWGKRLTHCCMVGRLGPSSCSGTYYDPTLSKSDTLKDITKQPSFLGAQAMGTAVVSASQAIPSSGIYRGSHATTEQQYMTLLQTEAGRNLSQVFIMGVSREPRLSIGSKANISGLPDGSLDGPCGVVKIIHTWSQSDAYKNEFSASLAAQWLSNAPPEAIPPARVWEVSDRPSLSPTARVIPGYVSSGSVTNPRSFPQYAGSNSSVTVDSLGHTQNDLSQPNVGLVSARVIDNNDPEHMSRLKVQYIWADQPTDWIRLASPSAGPGRGMLFLPEIGDEVVVSFENGDPNYPLVLGSLWNSANNNSGVRETFVTDDSVPNNLVKRFRTPAGVSFLLSDVSTSQGVVISDNLGQQIQILSNVADTGRPMIALTSLTGDIFLGAPKGRVHINAAFFSEEIGTAS